MERQEIDGVLRRLGAESVPSWDACLQEAAALRGALAVGAAPWPPEIIESGALGEPGPNAVKRCDPHSGVVFAALPSVRRLIRPLARELFDSDGREPAVSRRVAHMLHSLVLWRHYGRTVYVLDATTLLLLSRTRLPKMPCRELRAPLPAFYCVFPTDAFTFPARAGGGPARPVEGVLVTVEAPHGTEHGSREMTLLVSARRPTQANDSERVVLHNLVLRPDQSLADAATDLEGVSISGEYDEVQVTTVRRTVIGLVLYLMSTHPNLEAVPALPRPDLSNIHNAAKRRRAEEREMRTSKLGYFHVRPPARLIPILTDELAQRRAAPEMRLLEQHWVHAYYRQQLVGPGRREYKLIHIAHYWRGTRAPDGRVRLVKIQPAQERPSAAAPDVTKRMKRRKPRDGAARPAPEPP